MELQQQKLDAKRALELQRDEARETREIHAISGLVGYIRTADRPSLEQYTSYVRGLVQAADFHLLNCHPKASEGWGADQTYYFTTSVLGEKKHPFAEAAALYAALFLVSERVRSQVDLKALAVRPHSVQIAVSVSPRWIESELDLIITSLLGWPNLTIEERRAKAIWTVNTARAAAAEFCTAVDAVFGAPSDRDIRMAHKSGLRPTLSRFVGRRSAISPAAERVARSAYLHDRAARERDRVSRADNLAASSNTA